MPHTCEPALRSRPLEHFVARITRLLPNGTGRAGLAGVVRFWLDEEWAPLSVHETVGAAAGDAYVQARKDGAQDMGDLVLTLGSTLMGTDFFEAFVGPYDVANKVVELLMQRQGIDVCCTSDDDATLVSRYEESLA